MDPAFTRKRTTEVSPNLKIFGGSGNHFLGAVPATALAIPR